MDQTTFIGTLGALIVLIAFIMNQIRKWKDDYLIYDISNFIGSLLLVIYALILSSYPFLVLNSVWSAISLRDVFADLKKDKEEKRKGFFSKWTK
jgi:uncharacterized membrane protein YdcZ (DUF606 family)